jgi:hypothetical protein
MNLKEQLNKNLEKNQRRAKGEKAEGYGCFKRVEGLTFWKPEQGKQRIDIIPWLTGKQNPTFPEGTATYVLEYYAHKGVGPENKTLLCPKKNYNQKCPICEHVDAELQAGAEWNDVSGFAAKRRCCYNVVDVGNKSKSIQLFEVSYHLFEKLLVVDCVVDGEIISFADLEEGKTVEFKAREKSFRQATYLEFDSFNFLDREPYPDNFYKKAHCLDEMLVLHDYDTINKIFNGEPVDLDADSDEEETGELNLESKEEKPAKSENVDVCPQGGTVGKDYDNFPECEDCEKWKKCMALQ